MEKKTKLTISGSAKKSIKNIEIAKTQGKNSVVIEKQTGKFSSRGGSFKSNPSKIKNMVLATGHSMMGWSLGPATGLLVTEVISGRKTSMDLRPFLPERT